MQTKTTKKDSSTTESRYLNVRQAACFTGFTEGTLYQFVYEKRVPHIKKGRAVRFDKDELIKWMDESRVDPMARPKKKGGLWRG